MPATVLNYFTNYPGVWSPPQNGVVDLGIDKAITPIGATVRLYESP
jgi:hypothetical protein